MFISGVNFTAPKFEFKYYIPIVLGSSLKSVLSMIPTVKQGLVAQDSA